MATGRAISEINNGGVSLKMSPPTVISGANISYDHCLETLVAPITTAYGEVRVNITIQDLK
jgi:CheY-specific phosphatase CheX